MIHTFYIFLFALQLVNTAEVHQTAQLSQGRMQLAATSVGQYALFAGGTKDPHQSASEAVDIFDSVTQTWTKGNLSFPSQYITATSVGNLALFADESGLVQMWDSSTSTWSTTTRAPRQTITATSVGRFALFAGLSFDSGQAIVDIFNAEANTWTNMTIPTEQKQYHAATAGKYALFAGGVSSGTPTDEVNIWDSSTGVWSRAYLSEPKFQMIAVSMGELALFGCGTRSTSLDIFNATDSSWTSVPFQCTFSFGSGTTSGNYVLFAGGYNYRYSSTVYIYEPYINQWGNTTLSLARSNMGATSIRGMAIFAGGQHGGDSFTPQIDIFSNIFLQVVSQTPQQKDNRALELSPLYGFFFILCALIL